jgi:predicted metal-dependent hydrolase
MVTQIELGDIAVEVVLKDIKNVHLSVLPPSGRVRISAPARMSLDTIRAFAVSKLDWIKKQQARLQAQERETRREYLDRESHFVWGKRYLLKVVEEERAPSVLLEHGHMLLTVRPRADEAKRRTVAEDWYREQLKNAIPTLLAKWEPLIGVRVERFFAQRMKTKWGSCNPRARSIRLNTDLAKKPRECLEYVVVHEMIHILEPTHNARFVALMDRAMPQWRAYKEQLNRLPISHGAWGY